MWIYVAWAALRPEPCVLCHQCQVWDTLFLSLAAVSSPQRLLQLILEQLLARVGRITIDRHKHWNFTSLKLPEKVENVNTSKSVTLLVVCDYIHFIPKPWRLELTKAFNVRCEEHMGTSNWKLPSHSFIPCLRAIQTSPDAFIFSEVLPILRFLSQTAPPEGEGKHPDI